MRFGLNLFTAKGLACYNENWGRGFHDSREKRGDFSCY